MRSALASVAVVLLAATPLAAGEAQQPRASQLGTVSQTIDSCVVTIEYSRPSLRGRTPFGSVVRWGTKWTPGANWATTFDVTRDVTLDGQPLPKGKYSVWMIPQETDDWTVIFHKDARRFHTQRPDSAGEQLRLAVHPEQGEEMETLAWYFPYVQGDSATLRMHWGTTMVPLRVRAGR